MQHNDQQQRAEAAAIRRRWITLGEFVAVAGLIVSALALWLNWSQNERDRADRRAEQRQAQAAEARLALTGTVQAAGARLAIADPAHRVDSITVTFPKALGVAAQTSSAQPVIEARWFAGPLLRLSDSGPDVQEGRLPVLITADYWAGDAQRHETGLYDVVWRSHGRLFEGRALTLKGITLQSRGATPEALDARWKRLAPRAGGAR